MNTKLIHISVASIFLVGAVVAAFAQEGAQKPPQKSAQKTQKAAAAPRAPVTPKPFFSPTAPKPPVAKRKTGGGKNDNNDVRGKIPFTITAANSDDTVAGTINYTIPDDARQKIAAITGKP